MKTTKLLCLVAFAVGLNSFASAAQITFGVESGSSLKNGQVFTVVGRAQGVTNGFQKNILAVGQLSNKPLTIERISTANLGGAPSISNQVTAQADGTGTPLQALGEVPASLGVIMTGVTCSNYFGNVTFALNTSRTDGRTCGENSGYNHTTCTVRSSIAASASACKAALSTASDTTLNLTSGSYNLNYSSTQVGCAIISNFDTILYDSMNNPVSERKSKQEYFDGDVAYCSCTGGTCTMSVI